MLGTQDPLADRKDLMVQLSGPPVLPQVVERGGEVVAAGQGVGVLDTLDPLADGKDLLVQLTGPPVLPHPVEREGEVATAVQGVGVLDTQDPLADGKACWCSSPARRHSPRS